LLKRPVVVRPLRFGWSLYRHEKTIPQLDPSAIGSSRIVDRETLAAPSWPKSLLVFARSNEGLDHLCIDEIPTELIQLGQKANARENPTANGSFLKAPDSIVKFLNPQCVSAFLI